MYSQFIDLDLDASYSDSNTSLPSESNMPVTNTPSKCMFLFFVCVRAFFVVSQGTWEKISIIHPHKVLPPHQDIIHSTH